MKKLEVFDPPQCCSTGVCGPSVDPKLVQFAADLHWLANQRLSVERYNLGPATYGVRDARRCQWCAQAIRKRLPAAHPDGRRHR